MTLQAKKLTPERLGQILHETFDGWGDIDPDYFEKPPKESEAPPEEMGGMYEALQKACDLLNT